jgi:hypothetical protein
VNGSSPAPHTEPGAIIPGAAHLARVGLGAAPAEPPASPLRFPDGGAWRVEIPSVEGPAALRAVIETADSLEVPVHRVSQGSGVMMLTDREIEEMLAQTTQRGIELCLFVGPRAAWDIGAQRFTPGSLGARARGRDGLGGCVAEAVRAAELGVTSLLVADEGVLWTLHQLRCQGVLPATVQLKLSVQAAPANPASFLLLAQLGADTINVPSDLTIAQLAELRAASPATIDFYLEAPDSIGGFVRLYDIAEVIRVAAPVYVKFGLRNAPEIYPSGRHLTDVVVGSAIERVRRARLGLDILQRYAPGDVTGLTMSALGARDQVTGARLVPPA